MGKLIVEGDLGIDTAVKVPVANMLAHGYKYIVRYISRNETNPKNATSTELAAYRAAGLGTMLVWEQGAETALDGRAGGLRDGQNAWGWLTRFGYPQDVAVLIAVDTDVWVKNLKVVTEYVQAFMENVKPWKCGVYGDADILVELANRGTPAYVGWLPNARAWSSARKTEALSRGLVHVLQQPSFVLDGRYSVDGNIVIQSFQTWGLAPEPKPPVPIPSIPYANLTFGEFNMNAVFISDGSDARWLFNGFVVRQILTDADAREIIAQGLASEASYTSPHVWPADMFARIKQV